MTHDALIVFTAKTVAMILENGGTSSWRLSPGSMRDVRYVVCTRNSDRAYDEECGPRTESHGEAFLVGKVSGLKSDKPHNNLDRYLVQFSEYALVTRPGFWTKDRTPTRYSSTDILKERGIDVDKLEWYPMPPIEERDEVETVMEASDAGIMGGLTIAQAKQGLSIKFGVPEAAIQIVING